MTRRHAAMTIILASLVYGALSVIDRARATDMVAIYTAVIVTLLFVTEVSRGRRR